MYIRILYGFVLPSRYVHKYNLFITCCVVIALLIIASHDCTLCTWRLGHAYDWELVITPLLSCSSFHNQTPGCYSWCWQSSRWSHLQLQGWWGARTHLHLAEGEHLNQLPLEPISAPWWRPRVGDPASIQWRGQWQVHVHCVQQHRICRGVCYAADYQPR